MSTAGWRMAWDGHLTASSASRPWRRCHCILQAPAGKGESMRADGPLKLLSEVRDLQIVDSEGCMCGICDDVELSDELELTALLVGPGAYRHRLPAWAFKALAAVFG